MGHGCGRGHVNDCLYASFCEAFTASRCPLWQQPTRGTATQSESCWQAWYWAGLPGAFGSTGGPPPTSPETLPVGVAEADAPGTTEA
jgi:hypothetical protein